MDIKPKKCRPSGKAKGFESCGDKVTIFRYGMCQKCFAKWLYGTSEGNEHIKKNAIRAKKDVATEKKQKIRTLKRELNDGNAMSLADTYFSRYIRLYHSIDGQCTCYTCGTIKPIKEVDNGHYMKRAHKSTRYNAQNCRPQCKICNGDTRHNGKQIEFRENLVNEIGEDMVYKIEALSKKSIKADYFFYKETSDYYRNQINELQKCLKVKYW